MCYLTDTFPALCVTRGRRDKQEQTSPSKQGGRTLLRTENECESALSRGIWDF